MPRRKFTHDFKVSAVKLVAEQGYTLTAAAKSLGVDLSTLRMWIQKFGPPPASQPSPAPVTEAELRAELARLREENRRLTMEREILKKATAFFAKEQP